MNEKRAKPWASNQRALRAYYGWTGAAEAWVNEKENEKKNGKENDAANGGRARAANENCEHDAFENKNRNNQNRNRTRNQNRTPNGGRGSAANENHDGETA